MKSVRFLARKPRAVLVGMIILSITAVGLTLHTVGWISPEVSAVADSKGKEAKSARLNELDANISALRNQLAVDPSNAALRKQLKQAMAEYKKLSREMGGDSASPIATGEALPALIPQVVPTAPSGCTPTTTSFTQSTPLAVPTGPAVVTSTLVVSGVGPYMFDVDLTTNLTHTFAADLDITLMSPAGTVVTLTTDNGAGNDNTFSGTVWDSDANPAGQVPYVTNNGMVTDHAYVNLTTATPLASEESFGAFIGEDPNGTWTITISDDLAGDGGTLDGWQLGITTFPAAPTIANTVASQSTPVAIPTGPAVVTSTIVVAGAGSSLLDVDVTTGLSHTFAADLDVTIMSPAGTVVTLTTDNGAGNDDVFNGTVWDDDANPAGQVPYVTNSGLVTDHPYVDSTLASPLVPEEGLAAFIGENPNGTWTITISDDLAGADGGTLNSWSLDIDTATCAAACVLTCPANITVSNDPNQCGAVVNYGPATPTGTCGVITASPPSGSFFPVGTTTVTQMSSIGGASCTFTITVVDTQPPSITCSPNITTTAVVPGGTTAVITFPPPTASDNCPGVTAVCTPPSGSSFPAGTTTVTCTATDASGNTATCSFTVNVTIFDVCIQDNTTRKILVFSSTTGQFQFFDCSKNITFSGTSVPARNFCKITLGGATGGKTGGGGTVSATANTCTQAATATVVVNGVTHVLNDSNMSNNTCGCL